jgi:KDO2-lipid IV(A) lauroyltransferase
LTSEIASGARKTKEFMWPYYGYLVAETVVRFTPQRFSYWLGARLVDLLFVLRPRLFDGLRSNLRHVLPGVSHKQLNSIARHNVHNLSRGWIDLMGLRWKGSQYRQRMRGQDEAILAAAMARGKGVVIVSMHLGALESSFAFWRKPDMRLAVLAEELRPAKLFRRVLAARETSGVEIIPLDVQTMRHSEPEIARRAGASAMRDVIRMLHAGGAVGMAIDRDLSGTGRPVAFFGQPASIPVQVVETAIRTGAAIVPVAITRTVQGVLARTYPEIAYDGSAELDREVIRVAEEVLKVFEPIILDHPDQWTVLDPIWKQP